MLIAKQPPLSSRCGCLSKLGPKFRFRMLGSVRQLYQTHKVQARSSDLDLKAIVSAHTKSFTAVCPRRIIVYSSGTGRTVFIGLIKVFTLIAFGGALWVNVAPEAVNFDGSIARALGLTLISTIPPLLLHALSHPYVATIHVQIPPKARLSHAALKLFRKSLSPDTVLQISTIRIWGTPKIWQAKLGQLRRIDPKWGRIENFILEQPHRGPSLFGLGRKFFIGDARGEKHLTSSGWWSDMLQKIHRRDTL